MAAARTVAAGDFGGARTVGSCAPRSTDATTGGGDGARRIFLETFAAAAARKLVGARRRRQPAPALVADVAEVGGTHPRARQRQSHQRVRGGGRRRRQRHVCGRRRRRLDKVGLHAAIDHSGAEVRRVRLRPSAAPRARA